MYLDRKKYSYRAMKQVTPAKQRMVLLVQFSWEETMFRTQYLLQCTVLFPYKYRRTQ